MTNWHHKKILVLGLGRSGLSMLAFLTQAKAEVAGYDTNLNSAQIQSIQAQFAVPLFTGDLQEVLTQNEYEILALSPGVSERQQPITEFKQNGGVVLGDIQILADLLQDTDSKIIAITGANGKTTTTSLVGFLCQHCGLDTVVAGNIGIPVLEAYLARQGKPADVWVLELSSFQLETTTNLNATAATVLNISEDHLDRYDDLLDYAHTKDRIFQGNGHTVQVLNADDPFCCAMRRTGHTIKWFSLQKPTDFWLDQDVLRATDETLLLQSELALQGTHNIANVLVAMALCEAIGLSRQQLLLHLRNFKGLPHRVETVAKIEDVTYIDDSKGTNVGATCAALIGLSQPIVLIAGGQGKGQDFTPLKQALKHKVRAVLLIGIDAQEIGKVISQENYPVEYFASLEEATQRAHILAQSGDIVLLSPACASYDMFKGYAHRSQVFIDTINTLRVDRS